MKKVIAIGVSVLLGAGGWYGYRTFWAADSGPAYRTAEVTRATVVSTVSATGTVEPLVQVLVGSQVSGTVMRWYADFNQAVEKGFVLTELDRDRYQRALDQRTAAVAVAKAQAEQAKVRYDEAVRDRVRIEGLFARSNASENELLEARATEAESRAGLHAAQAQVLAAEAEQKAAAVDVDKTVIRSPITGVVISRDIDEGQTVAASLQAPTLFTIAADLKRMRVHANVSETDIGVIREGMAATFTVDAYPGRKFRGTVTQARYNPTIVENVVTYVTLIDVDNDDLALRPGMTATIAFEVARIENVLTVPNAALRFKPAGESASRPDSSRRWGPPQRAAPPTVFRLESGRPVPIAVTVGVSDGSRTQVDGEGIEEGLPVVVEEVFDRRGRRFNPARAMRSLR